MLNRLVYLMASGVDVQQAVLQAFRAHLHRRNAVLFAHRYGTHFRTQAAFDQLTLTESEFRARREAGLFALAGDDAQGSWAVGTEINQWLCKGMTVVMEGTASVLNTAQAKYPELLSVHLSLNATANRLCVRLGGHRLDETHTFAWSPSPDYTAVATELANLVLKQAHLPLLDQTACA